METNNIILLLILFKESDQACAAEYVTTVV